MGDHHQSASSGRARRGQDHQATFWAGSLGIAPAPQGHRPAWEELARGCSPPTGNTASLPGSTGWGAASCLPPGVPPLSPSAARVGLAQQPRLQEGWRWPPGTGAQGLASREPAQPRFRAGGTARGRLSQGWGTPGIMSQLQTHPSLLSSAAIPKPGTTVYLGEGNRRPGPALPREPREAAASSRTTKGSCWLRASSEAALGLSPTRHGCWPQEAGPALGPGPHSGLCPAHR